MGDTSIEWTDKTWNPVTGCTKVSDGCKHCYAERLFPRAYPGRAFTKVRCHPERLEQPLRWRKPQRIFVNSMSDLFHEDIPDEFIGLVFRTMCHPDAARHTFQILTKRPERMLAFCRQMDEFGWIPPDNACGITWPLPNVWLGVSVENQETADERIPLLLQTPAAVRFISAEPLLGPIDLKHGNWIPPRGGGPKVNIYRPLETQGPSLDWVIVGGESGPKARPMHPQWARDLRDQCVAAGVPYFLKQFGEWAARPWSDHAKEPQAMMRPEHPSYVPKPATERPREFWMFGGGVIIRRVGKKAAGRELDGRTWDEYPTREDEEEGTHADRRE